MTKVLVATEKPFAKVAVDGIRKVIADAGFELVLLEKYTSQQDFINAMADVDAVIIRSDLATKEVIDAGKKLKIIVRAGAGYDNIDLAAATAKGVVAMNTPGQNSNAVAELALGMMIYQARNHFDGSSGTEIMGKTLGLHAYGFVPKFLAKKAKGFNMDIYAFDPYISKDVMEKDGVKWVGNLDELYSKCQYVSLHIPANEQTKKSINFKLLSKMPAGATLINTARKEVIDEESLLKMFAERKDFRYVSDVEPDCKATLAEQFPGKFYVTAKKSGAQTEEANINAGIAAAKQIVAFLNKGDKTYQVNK